MTAASSRVPVSEKRTVLDVMVRPMPCIVTSLSSTIAFPDEVTIAPTDVRCHVDIETVKDEYCSCFQLSVTYAVFPAN